MRLNMLKSFDVDRSVSLHRLKDVRARRPTAAPCRGRRRSRAAGCRSASTRPAPSARGVARRHQRVDRALQIGVGGVAAPSRIISEAARTASPGMTAGVGGIPCSRDSAPARATPIRSGSSDSRSFHGRDHGELAARLARADAGSIP